MGGILDWFSDTVNSVTNPLGFKLFPGGPYNDKGLYGQSMQDAAAYYAQLAQIIGGIAGAAGVADPTRPLTTTPEGMNTVDVTNENRNPSDWYALTPQGQAQVNATAAADRSGIDEIMARVEARLDAQGMGNSATKNAARAYLEQQLQEQLGQEDMAAHQQAYNNRMNATQSIAQLLGTGFQAKQQATQAAAQNAVSTQTQANQQLGTTLALLLGPGGLLNKGGTPPTFPVPTGGAQQPATLADIGKAMGQAISGAGNQTAWAVNPALQTQQTVGNMGQGIYGWIR